MRVLVTGGCGFIGSHLANFLKSKGFWVRVVDSKDQSNCFLPLRVDEVLRKDLRASYDCFLATKEVDWVFNLAANMGGIGYITKVGAEVMHDNVLVNVHLLEACRLHGIKRVLFTSSACIYPTYRQQDANVEPLKEAYAIPANPDNYYGWEKLFTEKLMEAYKRDYGLEIRIARLHNVYGPFGTFQGGREKAPAALCRKVALAKDGDSIVVWGDGKQTRSFLYIDDCVRGLWMLMNSDYEKPLNIGSNHLITIDDLAKLIIAIAGKTFKVKIKHDLSKPQGVRGRNADLSLVKKVIGWQPKVSLRHGLEKTYHWIEEIVKNG